MKCSRCKKWIENGIEIKFAREGDYMGEDTTEGGQTVMTAGENVKVEAGSAVVRGVKFRLRFKFSEFSLFYWALILKLEADLNQGNAASLKQVCSFFHVRDNS